MFDWRPFKRTPAKAGIETGSRAEECNYCLDTITQYQDGSLGATNKSGSASWAVDIKASMSGQCNGKECPIARICRERG